VVFGICDGHVWAMVFLRVPRQYRRPTRASLPAPRSQWKTALRAIACAALRACFYDLRPLLPLFVIVPHAVAARHGLRVAGDRAVDFDAIAGTQCGFEFDDLAEDAAVQRDSEPSDRLLIR